MLQGLWIEMKTGLILLVVFMQLLDEYDLFWIAGEGSSLVGVIEIFFALLFGQDLFWKLEGGLVIVIFL